MKVKCSFCGCEFEKTIASYNRAILVSPNMYCSQTCTGLARRMNKTKEQKIKEKYEYDKKFREDRKDQIKIKKQEYHKKTYNKEKAALERKEKMPKHIEYCRQPEYKKYKKQYDEKYRAKKEYGDFAEVALILFKLEEELDRKSPELLQVKFQNGTLNKSQKRKRLCQQQN